MCITIIFLIAVSGYSIGDQHCTFRSQSTQGAPWSGTVSITNEKFDITVYHDYLDVELEWELAPGGTKPQEYSDALEIVGNLNLEPGSIIVGMLLWYKGEILKAKLKNKNIAREQYEEVVDRDAEIPPPPHDPVLLEYGWGPDNYYISVFPVVWNQTRKVRFRYLVPRGNRNVPEYMGYPHPFTNTTTVIVRKSEEIGSLATLSYDGTRKEVEDDSVVFTTGASVARGYGPDSYRFIIPGKCTLTDDATVLNISRYTLGEHEGELAVISNFAVGKLLNSVKEELPVNEDNELEGELEVYALVSNGTEICSTGVKTAYVSDVDFLSDSLYWKKTIGVFSSKQIEKQIEWHVYLNGELFLKKVEPVIIHHGETRLAACIAAASGNIISLDTKLPNSFAAAFGYVDTLFALLALEEDTLSKELQDEYAESGVPLLEKEDIFAADEDLEEEYQTQIFIENEYNIPLEVNYHKSEIDVFSGMVVKVYNGILFISFENSPMANKGTVEVTVLSLSGRILKKEMISMANADNQLKIGLNGIYSQTVIVRVKAGNRQFVKVANIAQQSL
ncbi:MAG: hypothetical protein JW863_18995 [Chitinispirillaceae bacterium]|nr:hypothetical protein [Chitinispirillaceae bacterium]